jgi:hypothetical protein
VWYVASNGIEVVTVGRYKAQPICIDRRKDKLFERAGGGMRIGIKRDPYLNVWARGPEGDAVFEGTGGDVVFERAGGGRGSA